MVVPEVVPEVIADKIMEAAENADVEGADFGVVRGHAFNDLETAIALSAANIPGKLSINVPRDSPLLTYDCIQSDPLLNKDLPKS